MIATQESNPRFRWLLAVLVVLLFVALGVPSRMLTQWAYAVERGKLRASTEELAVVSQDLARIQEVSHAFRLVAKVARPGVVHIRLPPDERALEELVELRSERAELRVQLERAIRQVTEGAEEQPSAADIIGLYLRLREIDDGIEALGERVSPASGSGIIFDEDGHILTNNHVIAGRGEIRVILPDEREYEAALIGSDTKTDLAVIKVDAVDLHPLEFGDSDRMEVGDWVIAIGAPFGFSQSVTHGIISATGRNDVSLGRGILYRNFLQTDAEINPGNSGGPLLNLRGEVIGVNTAIATRGDGFNAGIAFTIPANMAVKIANQLKQTGQVARGWLGISLHELSSSDGRLSGLEDKRGVMVNVLLADSPALAAGLLCEDVILAVDGVPTSKIPHVQAAVADISPGQTANLTILRDGREMTVGVRLGRQPDDLQSAPELGGATIDREFEPLALRVRSMRAALPLTIARYTGRRELALRASEHADKRGVFVVALAESAGARPVDIQPGELVVSCNGRPVETVAALAQAFKAAGTDETITLEVVQPSGERHTVEYERK